MSGQTASTGTEIGRSNTAGSVHDFLPIPFFFLGLLFGLFLQPDKNRHQQSRVFRLIVFLLCCVVGASCFDLPGPVSITGLAMAMGMMNTTYSQIGGQSANVGFVTGDLKNIAEHLVDGYRRKPVLQAAGPGDSHWRRAGALGSVWGIFLGGAVLGGALSNRFHAWALIVPIVIGLILNHDPAHETRRLDK